MSKSILKNLSYNVLLQIVLMVIPLISIPYVSRILGAEGIGTYSFTLSITQYFIIFGTLGIALYGNRQIAYVRNDLQEMSQTFWAIFTLRLITTSIALVSYYLIFWFDDSFRDIRFIQSLHIVSAIFDITWLFTGIEDFKRVVTRNLFIKIIGLIAVFIFVNDANDVMIYTLINVGMSFFSSLIMWLYVPRLLVKVKISKTTLSKHFFPVLKLFIPQIASQVYVLLDKTMLGYLANVEQVGFYTQAERIIKSVLEVISALGVVMLPRMSNIFASGDHAKMKVYLNSSLVGVSYVAVPMVLGIMGVTNEFVPWFFGPGFDEVKVLMIALSPILIFISLSSVLGVQYLLPSNRVNEFTISIVSGAIVNLTLNWLLIPKHGALGAVIGTIGAELTVLLFQMFFVRESINFQKYIKGLSRYLFAGVCMYGVVRIIGSINSNSSLTSVIQVFSGIFVYISILTFIKEDTNHQGLMIIKNLFVSIKNRIIK